MYHRVSGASFTVKNSDERKEIIKQINEDSKVSMIFECIGLDVEQFTGKIKTALLKTKDNQSKILSYNISGNFPTLKLSYPTSNNTYIIEFPNEKQTEVKKHRPKPDIVIPRQHQKEEVKREVVIEREPIEDSVVKISEDVEDVSEPVVTPKILEEPMKEEQVEVMKVSKRRKKKQ